MLTLAVPGIMLVGAHGAKATECSNADVRAAQFATSLPDCRAYEIVSPPDGSPSLLGAGPLALGAQASIAGNGIAWFSRYPVSSSIGGGFYDLSTRGAGGWETESVGPLLSPSNTSFALCHPAVYFSRDLSQAVVSDGINSAGAEQPAEEQCGSNDPPLSPGEPEGFQNLFLRNSASGAYALVDVTPPGATPGDAVFQDASSEDFSHIVFEDGAQLTSGAPAGASLYEWVGGVVHLVTVLPNGTPSTGVFPEAIGGGQFANAAPMTHPVSADGTRVLFRTEGKLYLRENVEREEGSLVGPEGECLEETKACTLQLDASQAGGPGGGGLFLAANAADTVIYFTDDAAAKLTADTAEGSGQHLYAYDTSTDALTDLTPAGGLNLAGLSGISTDGSYLYVVATSVLAEGATAEQPNLYLFHAGAIEFIATLEAEETTESFDWVPTHLTARVSSDGRFLAFDSMKPLTGYDNTPSSPGECLSGSGAKPVPCEEIFLFDSSRPRSASNPTCVSCDPNGEPPTGPSELQQAEESSGSPAPVYLQHNLLDDGRIYFDTVNSLLPGATNGASNVYENAGGHLSLISSGSSNANSYFYDASANGQDVFFVTTQHLVRGDTGGGLRLYDARVNGGFLEPEAPVPCSGEGCRGTASGGLEPPALATSSLQGSGNLPAAKHAVTPLTRRQKLERALRACRRVKRPRKHATCIRQAHRLYGARSAKTKRGGGK